MVSEEWLFTFADGYDRGEVFYKSDNLPIIIATWELNAIGEIVFDNPSNTEIPEQVAKSIRLNAFKTGRE